MLKKNERAKAVQAARRLLGLRTRSTMQEIKEAYRELARASHPDGKPEAERPEWEEKMRSLNAAYELLMDYCSRYTFSFADDVVEEQCRKQDPFEYWKNQYMD